MDIEELVDKAQRGNLASLEALCRQFAGLLQKAASGQHLRTVAEDALSVTRQSFFEAVKSYRVGGSVPFAGYAKSKVRFAVWNFFKRQCRLWQNEMGLESGEWEEEGEAAREIAGAADTAAEAEARLLLGKALAIMKTLPDRQRRVMFYTVFCGYDLSRTAALLGISPQAAHALKKRAVNFLKNHKDLAASCGIIKE